MNIFDELHLLEEKLKQYDPTSKAYAVYQSCIERVEDLIRKQK